MSLFSPSNYYIGKQIGTYTIEKLIGEGRYSRCFLARSITGDQVILKKFKRKLFKRRSEQNDYEAVILSTLQDARVPAFLGVINQQDFYGFVLEYKKGETIRDLLFKSNHQFTSEEFYDIGLQLIQIIKHLHEKGIVHRDIRLSNVILHDGVCLIDYGLARWADPKEYPYDIDFSYLGDFLLYLLYSSYEPKEKQRKVPWHKELLLTAEKQLVLKKLLGLESPYTSITDVEVDFNQAFGKSVKVDHNQAFGNCAEGGFIESNGKRPDFIAGIF
jgi:serine/threonine protein kinase